MFLFSIIAVEKKYNNKVRNWFSGNYFLNVIPIVNTDLTEVFCYRTVNPPILISVVQHSYFHWIPAEKVAIAIFKTPNPI